MSAANVAAWRISLANTPEQIGRCCSVMRELRHHIKAIDFAARVLHQQNSERSRGFGAALFDWLVEHANEQACEHLTLDSGVQRFAAHRFYLNRGMDITSHHFQLKLNAPPL